MTLQTPSSTSLQCNIDIVPLSLNLFKTPVTLTAQCPVGTDVSTLGMYWYDPLWKRWSLVSGSTSNTSTFTVSAPLRHFSTYSVQPTGGKASW